MSKGNSKLLQLADNCEAAGYTPIFNAIADATRPMGKGGILISVKDFIASLRARASQEAK
jgi:hypothetical protein